VVLGAGDELRVACDGAACGRAALALDRGEALVSAAVAERGSAAGVRLLLPGGGVLEVLRGAAHVAVTPGGETAVALREDGEALFTPARAASAGPAERLVGPASVVVSATGVRTSGRAAATLFRDLEFFGGPLRRGSLDRDVSVPLWRIKSSGGGGPRGALARASDAEGLPAVRLDLAPGESARLAWLPDGAALVADRLEVRLEVRSGATGPGRGGASSAETGPRGRLSVSVPGVPGATASAEAAPASEGARRLTLPLAAGWASAGRETEIVFTAADAPVRAWFTGAVFRAPAASPGGGR
jgi:hypothetical protein